MVIGITSVYRSGEEGRYPEMERQCEDKIEKLNPTRSDLYSDQRRKDFLAD